MLRNKLFLMTSVLAVLGLLLTGCSSVAAPTPKPPTSKEIPTGTPGLAASPTTPAPTPKAAAQEPRYGGILNIAHPSDPSSYDPIQESSSLAVTLVVPSYSGIVQHDPLEPTRVIGDLAEKWDMSQDGLSYTFHLYKNVKWHDGTPFTSEDARFTLETVRKPPRGVSSPRQEWLKAVDKIEATDKDTIRMSLSYPSASFIHNLGDGRVVMVPKHVFEAKGNMKRDIVGTGPYKFKSFTSGASFSVFKNPDYFIKGRPYLEGITWYIIADAATRFAALRTRRVQALPWASQGLTPSQAETIKRELSENIAVDNYPSLSFQTFWMRQAKAPWSDIRVRRVVDMAIDRPNVIKVASEGVGGIGGFMPPGGVWSLPEEELLKMPGWRQPKDADIAEAKRLLAEAGYAQGIKTATILSRVAAQRQRAMVALKEQLAPIGIEITIDLKDQVVFDDLLLRREFDTAYQGAALAYDDPDQVFGQNFVTGVPKNFSDFSDEKIDQWYNEQARTLDPARRKQIVLDIQRRLHELLPASMVYWFVFQLARWKEVRDFRAGIGIYNNLKLQNVWLAQ